MLWLVFLACGIPHFGVQAETSPPAEDTLLKIEAGRLDARLDQVALLLRLKADDTGLSMCDDVEAEIRDAVKRYNVCSRSHAPRGLDVPPCGNIYMPSFSSSMPLQERIDDATSRIYSF